MMDANGSGGEDGRTDNWTGGGLVVIAGSRSSRQNRFGQVIRRTGTHDFDRIFDGMAVSDHKEGRGVGRLTSIFKEGSQGMGIPLGNDQRGRNIRPESESFRYRIGGVNGGVRRNCLEELFEVGVFGNEEKCLKVHRSTPYTELL